MPNHCYSSAESIFDEQRGPKYHNWDWEVEWNVNLYQWPNYPSGIADSQEEVDGLLCQSSVTRESNIPSTIDRQFYQGTDISNAVGLTIDNTLIFNSLQGGSDILEQQQYSIFEDYFDDCLNYIDQSNFLSVRTLCPCIKNGTNGKVPGTNRMNVTH